MATDLVVSFLSGVPAAIRAKFVQPTIFLQVPAAPLGKGRPFYASYLAGAKDGAGRVIPGLFQRAGGSGPIGRVAVFGFSNGVDSGVSQLLEASDAQKIDFLGAFDGIHGSFVGGRLYPPAYAKWIAFGMRAAAERPSQNPNSPVMVVTHSSIEPTFPSTTETAALLWQEVTARAPADYEATYWSELDAIAYPGGLTIRSTDFSGSGKTTPGWTWQSFDDGWYVRRIANGLSVFGWGEPGTSPAKRIGARTRDQFNGTADHIFQAQAVLPAILDTYLVKRWNPTCGELSGLGGEGCAAGQGTSYDAGPEGPLADPFPLGVALPEKPTICPYPSSGVLVGSSADPCATAPLPIPPPPTPPAPPSSSSSLAVFAAVTAGAALGYAGASMLLRS